MRKMSAVVFSWRSGRSPVDGVMVAMRDRPRSGQNRPDRHDAVMRRDDQPVELVVGVVGEREHHPVRAAFARAHLDAADDAVGAGRGGDLDAVAVAVLLIGGRGEVDRGRVAAHVHRFDGMRRLCRQQRGGEREQVRKAQDQCKTPGRGGPSHAAIRLRRRLLQTNSPARFLRRQCADFAAHVARRDYRLRLARAIDRKLFQRVSTILPICALDSISAWAAAASSSGKVL